MVSLYLILNDFHTQHFNFEYVMNHSLKILLLLYVVMLYSLRVLSPLILTAVVKQPIIIPIW